MKKKAIYVLILVCAFLESCKNEQQDNLSSEGYFSEAIPLMVLKPVMKNYIKENPLLMDSIGVYCIKIVQAPNQIFHIIPDTTKYIIELFPIGVASDFYNNLPAEYFYIDRKMVIVSSGIQKIAMIKNRKKIDYQKYGITFCDDVDNNWNYKTKINFSIPLYHYSTWEVMFTEDKVLSIKKGKS